MKRIQFFMVAAFSLALPAFAAAQPVDLGPEGGAGGGEFRTACDPGDSIVGFDVQFKTVVTRIAPVCGVKDGNGTVGRPFVGSEVEGAAQFKPRCPAGSILTVLDVFIDKTPLVSGIGFVCFDRQTRQNHPHPPIGNTGTSVNHKNLACKNQTFGTAIFGRAGTAIDALGLHCENVD